MERKKSNSVGHSARSSNVKGSSVSKSDAVSEPNQPALLETFFVDELKDMYWAEKHLVKALTKMAKEATTQELKQAFEDHKLETQEQVSRLEEVFNLLGKKPQAKKCEAIAGITEEVEHVIRDTPDDTFTRDAALIIGAQKAEHYEIATYGGLVQLANTLGRTDIAEILRETLEEEKNADELLTEIAEGHINEDALSE